MRSSSTKILILVVLITLAVFGGFYFVIHRIKAMNAAADVLKSEVVDAQVRTLKNESLRQVAISGADELGKIEKYIIEDGKEVDVVQQIEGIAAASGLTYNTDLIAAKESATLTPQKKELLTISISTVGTWKNTRKFLTLIENLPYNVKIDFADLSLRSGDGTQEAGEWAAKFEFSLVKKKAQ
ncbi:MAG: hypothetical protein RL094_89 [Candidatus Parcubacteria bacterium]|jgi:Tfp pilus assembly protein PilO